MNDSSTKLGEHTARVNIECFVPPRCPHRDCASNVSATPFRHRRHGHFVRKCDGRRVPRFRCLICSRGFSSQSFRLDYRLRRPQLLTQLFELFVSKVTLRQASRIVGAHLDTVALHQRRLGEHCRRLQYALIRTSPAPTETPVRRIAFDELETFEGSRIRRPVTAAVTVDADALFIYDLEVGKLPQRGSKQAPQGNGKAAETTRRSGSRRAVRAALRRTAASLPAGSEVVVVSDKKTTYPNAIKRAFGARCLRHIRVDSKAPRTPRNPLFPANLTLAMLRDGVSRLVRRSWAHSKHRGRLRLHLWIWVVWRNWHRPRTVREPQSSAAMAAGLAKSRLPISSLLGWHGRFEELIASR